jgi:CPA2 family monovalent cation:H+ antiporter-2
MHVAPLIQDLALILALASGVVLVFHKIKQPVVLGYIVAGLLVSGVRESENIQTLAELGVIFLMFSLGLEFSFRKLAKIGGQALFMGLFETTLMFAGGWTIGHFLFLSPVEKIFLGGMVAISSTTVIAKAFEEKGIKSRRFAQSVMGVLIVEDLIAILLLVALGTLTSSGAVSPTLIARTLGSMVLIVGGWFLVGYLALPRLIRMVGRTRSDEILVVTSTGLCLALGVIGTRYHFSPALGAFIMGSILAESSESHQIERLIRPMRDLFVAVFFVSVGMMIQPGAILSNLDKVFILVGWVLLGKLLAGSLAALAAGKNWTTSIQIGASLTQIGEFSFILATLGLSAHALSPELQPVIVAVSIITTLVTPVAMEHATGLATKMEAFLPKKLMSTIELYSQWRESLRVEAEPRRHLAPLFSRWLIAGLVVTIGSQVGAERLIPFLESTSLLPIHFVPQTAGTLTALVMLPFLWRFLRGITVSAPVSPGLRLLRSFSKLIALLISGILGFPFFEGTPVILLIALAVIVTVIRAFRPLGSIYEWFEKSFLESFTPAPEKNPPGAIHSLAPWENQLIRLRLHPDSEFSGMTLLEAELRNRHGINIVAIQRGSKHWVAPKPDQQLFPWDEILVLGSEDKIEAIRGRVEGPDRNLPSLLPLDQYELRSVHVPEGSFCSGKTLREIDLRGRLGALVTGIEREGKRILNPDSDFTLHSGDTLWVVGESQRLAEIPVALQKT